MKKNILFIVVLIGLLSNTIFAMTPTWPNDAKFNRSVSNAYYYVDSSASSYTYQINDAIDNCGLTQDMDGIQFIFIQYHQIMQHTLIFIK